MKTIARHVKQASFALLALSALGAVNSAYALGTVANTSITNRATVSYTVGSVSQTPVESSPAGNSTAGVGAGADTTFVVDDRIDLTVTELSGNATTVTPGQNNVVAVFTVANTGNAPHAFQLSAQNNSAAPLYVGGTDNADVNNLRVFVDANANGVYEPATDTAVNIATLAPDTTARVLIVADAPLTMTNGQFANVRLIARAAVNNTPGTLATQTAGADTPGSVDIVFGDGATDGTAARDATAQDEDQFAVQSASLSVAKTSSVISDPFNGTTNPKAVPAAVVQYAVTITNTGGSAATGVQVVDPLPANTTFVTGAYTGSTDVEVQIGAGATTRCVAEAGGTDTNADGCYRNATQLLVGAPMAVATVNTGAANAVQVRFQVTIN
ncbi:MAG: hypothetical protein ABW110_09900 [Steroidobacteraceae bacterium]